MELVGLDGNGSNDGGEVKVGEIHREMEYEKSYLIDNSMIPSLIGDIHSQYKGRYIIYWISSLNEDSIPKDNMDDTSYELRYVMEVLANGNVSYSIITKVTYTGTCRCEYVQSVSRDVWINMLNLYYSRGSIIGYTEYLSYTKLDDGFQILIRKYNTGKLITTCEIEVPREYDLNKYGMPSYACMDITNIDEYRGKSLAVNNYNKYIDVSKILRELFDK